MRFTDIFIKRPVLATVVSLMILLTGLQSLAKLPIRQYPELTNTTITITTIYPGANAELIKGFITTPIAAGGGERRRHRHADFEFLGAKYLDDYPKPFPQRQCGPRRRRCLGKGQSGKYLLPREVPFDPVVVSRRAIRPRCFICLSTRRF